MNIPSNHHRLGTATDNVVTFVPRDWNSLSPAIQLRRLERLHVQAIDALSAYNFPDDDAPAHVPKLRRQTAEGIDRLQAAIQNAKQITQRIRSIV